MITPSTDHDVVVIGSGAGGLTAAVALARGGLDVRVLEQHTLPGGWCHSFDLGGFSFSPGVHYLGELGPQGRMRQIYEGLGVMDDLQFEELDPDGIDNVHIGTEFSFAIPKGADAYVARLSERFPADADGIAQVVSLLLEMARELAMYAIEEPPGFTGLAFRSTTLMRHGLRSLAALVEPRVTSPLARSVLYAVSGDHAMPASTCPAVLHAAVFAHYVDGAWYPRGGGRALPKAFIKELRRNGGQIRTGCRVARVLVEGCRAVGVELVDGTELRARHVISNADPHATAALVAAEAQPWRWRWRLPRTAYSTSCVSLFLAAEIDPAAHGITSGNQWLFRDADALTAEPFGWDPDPASPLPAAFLTCTSAKDPSKRKQPGVATFEAFAFVPYDVFAPWADTAFDDRPPAYEAAKRQIADRVLDAIETRIPGFRERLVFQSVGSPLTNHHYVSVTQGAVYGTERAWYNMGPCGYGPATPIKSLWMCGASTMSHGIAGATMSGIDVAARVLGVTKAEVVRTGGRPVAAPKALTDSAAEVARGR